ncbi:hypothetical protein [Methanoplanus endosymbiosus]|uniref:Uncharacterized protein n=1 Tax=Methanoplanus endosymbiosus TaxID=33865 RepID=A0A9E7PLY0_9EURY|nr:hypothetical protein [Methanoplanus endosymbiosus]UUX92320.1 hypothetical protein L6E24_13425 [Methanoplanus endosymbiosus]
MDKKYIYLLFLIAFFVGPVAGSSVEISSDNGNYYLSFQSEGNNNVAAYTIQLNFTEDTKIVSLEPLSPYAGAINIQNDDGYAIIAAYSIGTPASNNLASLEYVGSDNIEIIIRELFDNNGKSIEVTNPSVEIKYTVTPTPVPYPSSSGYVAPGSKEIVASNPSTNQEYYDDYNQESQFADEKALTSVPTETPMDEEIRDDNQNENVDVSNSELIDLEVITGDGVPDNGSEISVNQEQSEGKAKNESPIDIILMLVGLIISLIIIKEN